MIRLDRTCPSPPRAGRKGDEGAALPANKTGAAEAPEKKKKKKDTAWDRDLPASPRSAEALRRLGVERDGGSRIRKLLDPTQLVRLEAVSLADHGRVMWVDTELAALFGFPVPRDQRLTPELERALLSALAFRLPKTGEPVEGRRKISMFADRYGGDGLGQNEGAGRAAFLPYLNLYAKGIGLTPLHRPSGGDDLVHESGMVTVREAAIEAIWGKVGTNLFTHGAARTLAILEVGEFVRWGEHDVERAGILIRTGLHARPAHVVDNNNRPTKLGRAFFLRAARELGFLGEEDPPNLRAVVRKMIDAQAETAAEEFLKRVLHGAISTSNILFSGEELDLTTMRSQARTAPVRAIPNGSRFGLEHIDRAQELRMVYRAMLAELSPKERSVLGKIDVVGEMERCYWRHLQRALLSSTGFKRDLAVELQRQSPRLVREYALLLHSMCQLTTDEQERSTSVLDVFGLLGALPRLVDAGRRATSFEERSLGLSAEAVRAALAPDLGHLDDRRRAELEKQIDRHVERFLDVYPRIVASAERLAEEFYDDLPAMRRSVARRAELENRPLDRLEHPRLTQAVDEVVRCYDPFREETREAFRRRIDEIAASSVRSVDGLLRQGKRRWLGPDAVEIEQRVVNGLSYAVRASRDGARSLRVSLPLEGAESSGYRVPAFAPGLRLAQDEVAKLAYHYTTDGWREVAAGQSPSRRRGVLEIDAEGRASAVFDLPATAGDIAHLEGVFDVTSRFGVWLRDGSTNFQGYSFVVPDRQELASIMESMAEHPT